MNLCQCKCGGYCKNRFIRGHNIRVFCPWKGKSPPNKKYNKISVLCDCDCGEMTKPGNKYIFGHNRRGTKHTDESKEKSRLSHLGQEVSEETRGKLSIAGLGNQKYIRQNMDIIR